MRTRTGHARTLPRIVLALFASCALVAALIGAPNSQGAGAQIDVTMNVLDDLVLSMAGCPSDTTNITQLGTIPADTPAVTPSDCVVTFGSSSSSAMLKAHQTDGGGDTMRPAPASHE